MYHVYDGGLNTNRAYLGTDTRSQCLFIGCALAVGLVLLTQRRHEEGRLAKGELWRPEGPAGLAFCGALGVVGAAGAVALWVLTTSTSAFPYSGGFFLIGLVGGQRDPRRRRGTAQHRPAAAVAGHRSATWAASPTGSTSGTGPSSYGSTHARTGLYGYELFAVRVVVTFAVSVVSFHLVERPIRMGTFVSQWRAWLVVPAGVGAVLVAVIAATTGTTAVASTALHAALGTTGVDDDDADDAVAPVAAQPVRVLLFGDSVALTLGIGTGPAAGAAASTATSCRTRGSSAAVSSSGPRSS